MQNQRLVFLQETFFERISTVEPDRTPAWGKMNLQQMIEHLSDSVRMANGVSPHAEILTPADRLQAVRDFLYSEKEFRPETRNALMGDVPPPVRQASLDLSMQELREELDRFVRRFDAEASHTERNPFFGDLDAEGWQRLFYKHFMHHLKQFRAD